MDSVDTTFLERLRNAASQKTTALCSVISFTYWLDPAHLFCLAEVMKILDTNLHLFEPSFW